MANNGVVISVPINIASDVYSVLGLSGPPFDIGYACKNEHGKINMWARYKPVPFRDVLAFNDTVKNFNGHSTWNDTPISQGVDGVLKRPWYMGGTTYKLYTVPEIDSYNDMFDSDGEPNPSSEWTYRAPFDGLPFRILDFVGYNHQAKCPLSAYVNYTKYVYPSGEERPGYAHIDGYIIAGFNNTVTWDDDQLAKENGELTLTDVLNLITVSRPLPLYLCIVLRNFTQNITRHYSKPVNILDENGRSFKLKIDSSENIAQGGVNQTVRVGDEFALGVYLSSEPGVESIGTQLTRGYSLNTGIVYSPHVCRKMIVGDRSTPTLTQYRIVYTISTFDYTQEGYIDELDAGYSGQLPIYMNAKQYGNSSDGKVYSFEKGISDIKLAMKFQKIQIKNENGVWNDTTRGIEFKYDISVAAGMYGGDNSGGTFIGEIPILKYDNLTGEDIRSMKSFSNSITGYCTAYFNQKDADAQRNGFAIRAFPLSQPIGSSQIDQFSNVHFKIRAIVKLHDSALFQNTVVSLHTTDRDYFDASN